MQPFQQPLKLVYNSESHWADATLKRGLMIGLKD